MLDSLHQASREFPFSPMPPGDRPRVLIEMNFPQW
jgi:hypothetical protein